MEWLLGLGVSAVVVVAVVVGVTRRKKPEAADTYTVTVSPDRYEPHDTPTVDIPANTSDTPADAPETEPVPAPSVPSASSASSAADTLTVAEELSGVATSPAADVSPVVTSPPMPPVPSQSAESSEDAQGVPQDSEPSPQEDAEVEVVEPPAEATDAEVEATVVDTEVESTPQGRQSRNLNRADSWTCVISLNDSCALFLMTMLLVTWTTLHTRHRFMCCVEKMTPQRPPTRLPC